MWLLLACAAETCPAGWQLNVFDECVPIQDADDTGEAPAFSCNGVGAEVGTDALWSFCGACTDGRCDYAAVTRAERVNGVAMDLADGAGWSEYHDAFVPDGAGTWTLSLVQVSAYEDYASNTTTRVDPTGSAGSTTVEISLTEQGGDWAGCWVFGADPSLFAGDGCTEGD
jgi:hypothetical protein